MIKQPASKPTSLMLDVLFYIAKHPGIGTEKLSSVLSCEPRTASTAASAMKKRGWVVNMRKKKGETSEMLWTITSQGEKALTEYGMDNKPSKQPIATARAAPITNGSMRDPYMGEELMRTAVRPGAMDAYNLPSLMGGELVYPAGALA